MNSINIHHEKTFKSMQQQLFSYFTHSKTVIPQSLENFYQFNIGDKVYLDALPSQRRQLGFKWSLNKGNSKKLLQYVRSLLF